MILRTKYLDFFVMSWEHKTKKWLFPRKGCICCPNTRGNDFTIFYVFKWVYDIRIIEAVLKCKISFSCWVEQMFPSIIELTMPNIHKMNGRTISLFTAYCMSRCFSLGEQKKKCPFSTGFWRALHLLQYKTTAGGGWAPVCFLPPHSQSQVDHAIFSRGFLLCTLRGSVVN